MIVAASCYSLQFFVITLELGMELFYTELEELVEMDFSSCQNGWHPSTSALNVLMILGRTCMNDIGPYNCIHPEPRLRIVMAKHGSECNVFRVRGIIIQKLTKKQENQTT